MRVVRRRSTAAKAVTIIGSFALGPFAASRLSHWLSPDGGLIQALAPFAFAAIFALGLFLWIYLGFFSVVVKWLGLKARGAPRASRAVAPDEEVVPPGYRAFIVVGTLIGAALGLATGLTTSASFVVSVAAWTTLGLGYGLLLRTAVHHGYFPFPDED